MIRSPYTARFGARTSRTIASTLVAVGAATLAAREAHASPDGNLYPCTGTEYDLRAMMETAEGPDANFDASGASLDDGSVAIEHAAFASVFPDGVPFFGQRTRLFANTNGNITFSEPMYSFTPDAIPGLNQPTIAPWFGDVDFHEYDEASPVGTWTMCVEAPQRRVLFTWRDVGYFSGHTDKRNSFQIALVDNDETCADAHNFALELRYEKLEWTTGDASGGSGGLGGVAAVAGLDSGDGTTAVALEGSFTPAVLGLVTSSNVGEPGVYRYLITEQGLPQCGNGVVDACEACDDGNDVDDDACTNTCQTAGCTNPFGCDPHLDDPCADGGGCGEHSECRVDEAGTGAVCSCQPGYVREAGVCVDVDECIDGGADCDVHATCQNTDGSYTCACPEGFTGDGSYCDDVDECQKDNPCDPHATCTNTIGGFACSCNPGFAGDGVTCNDVDECESDDACGPHSSCVNQAGNFHCTCDGGFRLTIDGCEDVDECTEGAHDCSPHATCTNGIGSFSCACDEGWVGDGTSCANVDECANGATCRFGAICVDDPGSWHCECPEGFDMVGGICLPEPSGAGGAGGGDGAGGSGGGDGGSGGGSGGGGSGGDDSSGSGGATWPGAHLQGPNEASFYDRHRAGPQIGEADGTGDPAVHGGARGFAGEGEATDDGSSGTDGSSSGRGDGGDDAGEPPAMDPGMTVEAAGEGLSCAASPRGGVDGSALGTLVAAAAALVASRRRRG